HAPLHRLHRGAPRLRRETRPRLHGAVGASGRRRRDVLAHKNPRHGKMVGVAVRSASSGCRQQTGFPAIAGSSSCRGTGGMAHSVEEAAPDQQEEPMEVRSARMRLLGAAMVFGTAVSVLPVPSHAAGDIDAARLKAADAEPQNWFTLGRDGNQTYYSPLSTIDASNVGRLGFAWTYDLATARGQEATPIVVDGVMYTSGTWC